jgi:transposase
MAAPFVVREQGGHRVEIRPLRDKGVEPDLSSALSLLGPAIPADSAPRLPGSSKFDLLRPGEGNGAEAAMGWAYSVDLREKVVGAFDVGDMTDEQVAELFQLGEATVHRWKRLKRETGSLVPRPPRGGGMPPRVEPEKYELVREIVRAEPDLTIAEVAWEFHRRTGRSVSPAAMGRTLQKLGLTRKKRA